MQNYNVACSFVWEQYFVSCSEENHRLRMLGAKSGVEHLDVGNIK
jgi:hypothetical protein